MATIVESILARSYAFVVVSLRYLIVGGWAAAVVLAIMFLPPLSATSSGGLSNLIPPGSAAARAEADVAHLFGFPIDAAVAIVQRDPHGMPAAVRDRAIRQAIAVDRRLSGQSDGQLATAAAALARAGHPDAARILSGPVSPGPPGGIPGLAGAFPLPNAAGLLRGTNEQSTTVITFLSFRPGTSFGAQTAGANAYVRWFLNRPDDHVVGVTGPVPAEYDQSQIIGKDILWVELFTVLAIALIVGVRFRSAGAPLATLACAATAYVIAIRVVVWLAGRMGVTLPPDLDPVLVVLLLGVTTDYTVFFLDGMRAQVAGGVPRIRAARLATAEFAPIILAAGIIVAAAAASLVVARTKMLSAFGPGLALTVLAAMAVSMTLGPALMAIFGGLLFRPVPRWLRRQGVTRREGGGREPGRPPARWNLRTRAVRFAAARPMALLIAAAGTAGLLAAAWGAHTIHLGSPLIRELPASASAARAGAAAADGFAPGILSPTEILVIGPGVARQTAALARLQHELATQPGVAEIAGPASLPGSAAQSQSGAAQPDAGRFRRRRPVRGGGEYRSARRDRDQPGPAASARPARAGAGRRAAGRAVRTGRPDRADRRFHRLGLRRPGPRRAGHHGGHAGAAGAVPAVAARARVPAGRQRAGRIRHPGADHRIGQHILGYGSLVYFVPFAAGVLLVSLGSDYNVFVVGRIWEEARRRPVANAVAVAAPQASRAITTAGVALAASFAMLAVIPLEQFRQIALAMALGVVLDAIAVRSLLVPALVALFGRLGMWPGNRRARPEPVPAAPPPVPAGDQP